MFGDEHHQDNKIIIHNKNGGGGHNKANLPAAVRPHVSQENENVIKNLQMHEHPVS